MDGKLSGKYLFGGDDLSCIANDFYLFYQVIQILKIKHMNFISKIVSFQILLYLILSYSVLAQEKLTINLDVKDDDGVIYGESLIQAYLDITNNTEELNSIQISWSIATDDWRPLKKITVPSIVKGNSKHRAYCPLFEFPGPGFYRISALVTTKTSETYIDSKVIGIDPEKISVPVNPQTDFDKFWENSLSELKSIKPEYKLIPQKREGKNKTNLFKVKMKSAGGLTVGGWLEVPKKKGKYPALLRVPGYQGNLKPIDKYEDLIVFSFNTRDHGESDNSGKRGYDMWVRGLESQENYYYRGLYLDCIRAVDFLCSRNDVDTSRIAVWGGSQGGGLSFSTAALDQRIDLCIADIPFLCEWQKYFEITYWKEVDRWFDENPKENWTSILKTLSYFDTKNMAQNITCPVYMGIGLQDDVCPPSTSFVTYNYIQSKKEYTIYKYEKHWQPEIHYANRFLMLRKTFKMD